MELPKLNPTTRRIKREVVQMRGINYGDQLQDGDLADSRYISARRFPYLSTIKVRMKQYGYSNATALTAWDKLVVVQNDGTEESPDYELYYDGEKIGAVSGDDDGHKQFAVVNTKLVIWPDKKYLDIPTKTIKPLGASAEAPDGAVFTENTVTFTNATGLDAAFKKGDAVEISGCATLTGNNKSFIVESVTADTITAVQPQSGSTFTEGTDTGTQGKKVSAARSVPDMDYICESGNRLWGCSSSEQTIYVSSLGDPTNFHVSQGVATDSYALAVASAGDFTGCCKLASSVLFWKEHTLHKILGSYPAEYQMYSYTVEGLLSGCHKSQQIINEVLYYVGLNGVYAYTGNTPALISANFGEHRFTDAVAGSDGDSYYLSCREGSNWHLFVYETHAQIWVREDTLQCVDFARSGQKLYFLDADGDIWDAASPYDISTGHLWYAQFTPFYETIEGRKRYTKLLFRFELPVAGSSVKIFVRTDGGIWNLSSTVTGSKADVVRVRVPIRRGDKYEIRLEGQGPCTVLSFMREFFVGGEQ